LPSASDGIVEHEPGRIGQEHEIARRQRARRRGGDIVGVQVQERSLAVVAERGEHRHAACGEQRLEQRRVHGLDLAHLPEHRGLGVAARAHDPAVERREANGIEAVREYHHRPTQPLDERGQGDAHVTFAFAAHRAVVDVDADLGLVRVVEIATAQDVGKAKFKLFSSTSQIATTWSGGSSA